MVESDGVVQLASEFGNCKPQTKMYQPVVGPLQQQVCGVVNQPMRRSQGVLHKTSAI